MNHFRFCTQPPAARRGGLPVLFILAVMMGPSEGQNQQRTDTAVIGPTIQIATAAAPTWFQVADLNGDGRPDIVCPVRAAGAVQVFLSNGPGTYNAPLTYAAGSWPQHVALADINGDGIADMVVSNYGSTYGAGTITRRFGNANGTFGSALTISAALTNLGGIAAGRLHASNSLRDVVVADTGQGTIVIYPNVGSGNLGTPFAFSPPGQPDRVVINDLDSDGDNDIIVSCNSSPAYLKVYGNTNAQTLASGSFPASLQHSIGGAGFANFRGFAVGNVTEGLGDSTKDMVVVQWIAGNGSLEVFRGTGNLNFVHHSSAPAGSKPLDVTLYDIDLDGHLDAVVVCEENALRILYGDGQGHFAERATMGAGVTPIAGRVADFDGDGRADIMVSLRGEDVLRVFPTIPAGVNYPVVWNGTAAAAFQITATFTAAAAFDPYVAGISTTPITPATLPWALGGGLHTGIYPDAVTLAAFSAAQQSVPTFSTFQGTLDGSGTAHISFPSGTAIPPSMTGGTIYVQVLNIGHLKAACHALIIALT